MARAALTEDDALLAQARQLALWRTRGLPASVVYDIGSHEGKWAKAARAAFPGARIECFEANTDVVASREDATAVHVALLGATDGDVATFYVGSRFTTGCSTFRELTEHFLPGACEERRLTVRALDALVAERRLPLPDFLKLDVQGAELDVLAGAPTCLAHASAVLLEVSLHRYNAGAPLLADVVAFMRARGFDAVDVLEAHIVQGWTAQLDMLFVRSDSGLLRTSFFKEDTALPRTSSAR